MAVFTIPPLIHGLGTERFGILALAWTFVGYFSVFDLGLGRALTKLAAERLDTAPESEVSTLTWTALGLMLVLGLAGAALALAFAEPIVVDVLNIPSELHDETIAAAQLLSLSIPIVVLAAGFRGLLEAYQRFGAINAVRVPLGILNYAGPLLIMPFTKSIAVIVSLLIIARLVGALVYCVVVLREFPHLIPNFRIGAASASSLLRFGGWLTVSSVVGPLLVSSDRFVIAALLSVKEVAYYATPYEVITKLLLIPVSIVAVLFPALSQAQARDKQRARYLYLQTVKYVLLILTPLIVSAVIVIRPILALWLDDEFAARASFVAQILAVGVLVNGVGLVSQSLVQSMGKPDWTAKLHLVELPMYFSYLYPLVVRYGIEGSAFAWLIRVAISTSVLVLLAHRISSERPEAIRLS